MRASWCAFNAAAEGPTGAVGLIKVHPIQMYTSLSSLYTCHTVARLQGTAWRALVIMADKEAAASGGADTDLPKAVIKRIVKTKLDALLMPFTVSLLSCIVCTVQHCTYVER